jgi:hypothetical protein
MASSVITEILKTHEERAQVIADMMHSRRGSEVGRVLAERAALVASVKWLANHIPVCVLNRLGEEIKMQRSQSLEDLTGNAQASLGDRNSMDSIDHSYDDDWDAEDDDFSNTMVRTQDLVSEIRREREGRRSIDNRYDSSRQRSFNGHEPLTTLSEDDDDGSIEYKEIVLPRQTRRRSSIQGNRRNSIQSFAEISELSLDGWDDSSNKKF